MAFSYRNTLDSAISALPQRYSDQVLADVGEEIEKKLKNVQKLFSFRISPEIQELLSDEGIELAPIAYQNHSHPACKMIENHFLYVVLPNLLKHESSVGLMSLRDEKANRFIKMRRFLKAGEFQGVKLFNSIIDGKDFYRYGTEVVEETFHERIDRINTEFETPDFKARVMLIHDELHFHTPENILDLFERVSKLRVAICTLVCPQELLLSEHKSKNPRIYGFEVSGNDLFFFPDGNPSEGYQQSVSESTWPLRTSSISRGNLRLRVTVLSSLFAHHIISIERTKLPGKKKFFLKKPSCLLRKELKILDNRLADAQIERKTMQSILTYLSCLKTPNQESAIAKLRQLEKRDLFEDELNMVSNVSCTFSRIKCWKGLDLGFLENLKDAVSRSLPWLSSFISEERVWRNLYQSFLHEVSIKWYEVELKDIVLEVKPRSFFQANREPLGLERPVEVTSYAFVSNEVFMPAFDRLPSATRQAPAEVEVPSQTLLLTYEHREVTTDHGVLNSVALCSADLASSSESAHLKDSARKESCVFRAIAPQIDMSADELIEFAFNSNISEEFTDAILNDEPLTLSFISELACCIGRTITGLYLGRQISFGFGEPIHINLLKDHCIPIGSEAASSLSLAGTRPCLPSLGVVDWSISCERASRLLKSFCRGTTGVSLHENRSFCDEAKQLQSLIPFFSEKKVKVDYIWGFPGSGKTKRLMDFLSGDDNLKAIVVSPRRLLADTWVQSLKFSKSRVLTFETALMSDLKQLNCLVVDELSLLPPGYLDLAIIMAFAARIKKKFSGKFCKNEAKRHFESFAANTQIVVIGDPMQARYYSETDEILLDRVHDIDIMTSLGAQRTVWRSFRMGLWFEKIMEIKCLGASSLGGQQRMFFSGLSAIKNRKYDAILCASREDKRDLAGSIPVLTFGESQGLTFGRVLIALTDKIHRVGDHHLFVGLTRSVEPFDFICTGTLDLKDHLRLSDRKLLGMVLRDVVIGRDRLKALFSGCEPSFIDDVGFSLDSFGKNIQDKSVNDIFIQPFCDLEDLVELEDVEPVEPEAASNPGKCHLPIVSHNPLTIEIFDKMSSKEAREFFHARIGATDQFIDVDRGVFYSEMGNAMRFEAIFPRHNWEDGTTFIMAVKKRLRFSNVHQELEEFRMHEKKGRELCDFFLSKLPGRFEINRLDVEEAKQDFVNKRLEKTASGWEAHSVRSDIDWPLNWVFMFMKSQLCTKSEKMWANAKAGQTLACFQHIVLFKMGPILRAVEKAFVRAVGDNFYVHSSKNFSDLNGFTTKNACLFRFDNSVESDYESFDASQDSIVLAFEVALLKKVGVPKTFIDDYVSLKVNLGSKLGSFAIMRFTGEFCTFFFNTLANMLFTFLTYKVDKNSRVLFAGDDMASIGLLEKRNSNDELLDYLKLFRLKAKEDHRKFPLFCGWFLTPDGIYKKPSLLWARLMVMKEKGLIKHCIDNYLLELEWAYRLGDKLFLYLDEGEMECHYKCVRFFIENSSMCRGEALKKLGHFGSTFGSFERFSAYLKTEGVFLKTAQTIGSSPHSNVGFFNQPLLEKGEKKIKDSCKPTLRGKLLECVSAHNTIDSLTMRIENLTILKDSLKKEVQKGNVSFHKEGKSVGESHRSNSGYCGKLQAALHEGLKQCVLVEKLESRVKDLSETSFFLKEEGVKAVIKSWKSNAKSSSRVSNFIHIVRKMEERRISEGEEKRKEIGGPTFLKFLLGPLSRSCVHFDLDIRNFCLWHLSKLMTSLSGLTEMKSRLMPFNLDKFTEMSAFLHPKYSTALEDLSRMLRSPVMIAKESFSRISHYWMMMRSDGSKRKVASTITFISEQFSSVSHPWSQTLRQLRGESPSLISQCLTSVKLTLPRMRSALRGGLLFLSSDLHIVYQHPIHIFKMLLKFLWPFQNSLMPKEEKHSHLTSESFTGSQTQRDFSAQILERLVGHNRRSGAQNCWNLTKRYLMGCHLKGPTCLSQLMSLENRRTELYSCLKNCRGKGLTELLQRKGLLCREKERVFMLENPLELNLVGLTTNQVLRMMKEVWGGLGPPRSELITVRLNTSEDMSLQEVLKGEILYRVKRFLWNTHVDPTHVLIPVEGLVERPAALSELNQEIYDRVLNHFLPFLFGNIAIIGTSAKVQWPSLPVPIPHIHFAVGGHEFDWDTEMDLSVICPSLDMFRRTCAYAPLRNCTFRSMCEPFADEAKRFIFSRQAQGVVTNIYSKWPRALDPAPWVAFDFASGLNLLTLSNDEKVVIDRMTKRLFRTEGQKGVFYAQGEVNIQMEG